MFGEALWLKAPRGEREGLLLLPSMGEDERRELCNGMLSLATPGRAPPIPSKAVKESGPVYGYEDLLGVGELK